MKIATIACPDGRFIVGYLLHFDRQPTEVLAAAARQILHNQARLDYGLDVCLSTMGCGYGVTTYEPLPAHRAIAAESYDFSLLRQGWRFHHEHYWVEPVPAEALGHAAYALSKLLWKHPALGLILNNHAFDTLATAKAYPICDSIPEDALSEAFIALRALAI